MNQLIAAKMPHRLPKAVIDAGIDLNHALRDSQPVILNRRSGRQTNNYFPGEAGFS
jgi:hypothetical protein